MKVLKNEVYQHCMFECLPNYLGEFSILTVVGSSSETQGQLVGTTGFSWVKVYNKSGRAPGQLLLPIQFQKHLNSLLLIFFWPISEEEQPGDSHVFLHEVVFLIAERRSSMARSTGTFLRRASEKNIC